MGWDRKLTLLKASKQNNSIAMNEIFLLARETVKVIFQMDGGYTKVVWERSANDCENIENIHNNRNSFFHIERLTFVI
ncbi:hypothetical protein A6V25_05745 [Nostoc sp. ATCC 53789]|nr:hypothetical protein A6V25_05745 [Nostoc sp. ATCC 53789]